MSLNQLSKSTGTNFELQFPKVPTESELDATKSLSLNIYETLIPSISLETQQLHWQNTMGNFEIGNLTFEPWFVHFTVDSKFENWITLYKWMIFINNNKDRHARSMDEYKIDAVLSITDNYKRQIIVIDFIGVWINMLGEVSLTYREGTVDLFATANFIYDRYEIRNI